MDRLWSARCFTTQRDRNEEKDAEKKVEGLIGFIQVTARLGDAHGDKTLALKTLENGIKRFPNAPANAQKLERASIADELAHVTELIDKV